MNYVIGQIPGISASVTLAAHSWQQSRARRKIDKINRRFIALSGCIFILFLLLAHPLVIANDNGGTGNDPGGAPGLPPDSALSGQIIWQVGPRRKIRLPSEAAAIAKDGDIIEIDAGVYRNDYAAWNQNNLIIRGLGGMAHLSSEGFIPNGKAIWIVNGADILIENVEFSGAKVKDTNGAGIRHHGGDLTLRNTFFHDNEFSILTGRQPRASLEISDSRFWFQKRPGTYSHGLYIGVLKRFALTGSHVKGTDRGHQIKSRALENHILYNRIEDIPGGNSSRLIDLPNCGLSFIIGNDMHQGASSNNTNMIGYGAEKCSQRSARQKHLYVINNTFVNEARGGTLVRNHAGGDILVANNLLFGPGTFLSGTGSKTDNIREGLLQWHNESWTPASGSRAIDAAVELPPAAGVSLVPARVFTLPAGTAQRVPSRRLDAGSREFR